MVNFFPLRRAEGVGGGGKHFVFAGGGFRLASRKHWPACEHALKPSTRWARANENMKRKVEKQGKKNERSKGKRGRSRVPTARRSTAGRTPAVLPQ